MYGAELSLPYLQVTHAWEHGIYITILHVLVYKPALCVQTLTFLSKLIENYQQKYARKGLLHTIK